MRAAILMLVMMICAGMRDTPAYAQDPVDSARAVISDQIAAFRNDDADKAYSLASPSIRTLFPDKDRFIDMVKKAYPPVFRPEHYAFGRSKALEGGGRVYQEVMISSPEGKDWTAIYELRAQPDGSYKINGVQMLRDTDSQGI